MVAEAVVVAATVAVAVAAATVVAVAAAAAEAESVAVVVVVAEAVVGVVVVASGVAMAGGLCRLIGGWPERGRDRGYRGRLRRVQTATTRPAPSLSLCVGEGRFHSTQART